MADYPPPYPRHGLDADDIARLYDAAWAEIEGSASAQCVVWKGGLRRLLSSYRDFLDAARTEGRGEGEPVAWAYEYTNHLRGDRAPGGWLRAVAFEAPTRARVNAGFARNVRPLYASPIREPEISRTKRDEIARVIDPRAWDFYDRHAAHPVMSVEIDHEVRTSRAKADAILNLAPVGGRGEVSASDRAFVRHLIREMRSAIADDPNDATITTGPLDPDILERVLNVALGAQEQGGMK